MHSTTSGPRVCLLIALLLSTATAVAQSGDWLQWGGPNRDFKTDVKGLALAWPAAGPPRIWTRELGEGYSAIAAEAGRLYTMYRVGDREVAIAVDAATGKTIWEYAYDAPFIRMGRDADQTEYNLEQGPGPHGMPVISGDRVFTMGATGWLQGLDKFTGKVLWKRHLLTEFQGGVTKRGFTTNPLLFNNMIIVPVGAVGASIAAFSQTDGSLVWKKHDFYLAYSTSNLIHVDGQAQAVVFMSDEIVGLNPDTGDLIWSHPAKSVNGTHISMPLWNPDDHLLFFSAAYGLGGRVLKLTRTGTTTTVQEVWHNPRARIHFSNAIRLGDVIYASTGDFGPAFFSAFDVHTGKVLWQERSLARASFVYADGRFIVVDEDGSLTLATPSEKGLTIHAQVDLLQSNAWTIPTLVGKTLYVRDRKVMMALALP